MTDETKAKIEAASSKFLTKLDKKYCHIEQANMPNIICDDAFTSGASYGYNLAVEELSKGGEFWTGELDYGIVCDNYYVGKIKVVELAALQSANSKIAQLEEQLPKVNWTNEMVKAQGDKIKELEQELEKQKSKTDKCLTYGLSYDDLKNGEFEDPIPSYSELQTKITTLEARLEGADKVIEQVQNHCLCERNSYGFDYHEKHRKLGPPESGKRWLTPVDMVRTYLKNKGG